MSQQDQRLPHIEAAAIFDGESGHQQLMSAVHYQFTDQSLLKLALTHPSVNHKRNNQRLEFLGDAVLQLVISEQLFHQSKEAEGKLTFKRQRLVNEQTLAQVARQIDLGAHLMLDKRFAQDGGRELDSVLADALEAVLAAIYLDGGLSAAQKVIQELFKQLITQADASLDAKGALQAYFQARGGTEPSYEDLDMQGPPHQRVFTVAVTHAGHHLATGTGTTKRSAQQKAAKKALDTLKQRGKDHEADQA